MSFPRAATLLRFGGFVSHTGDQELAEYSFIGILLDLFSALFSCGSNDLIAGVGQHSLPFLKSSGVVCATPWVLRQAGPEYRSMCGDVVYKAVHAVLFCTDETRMRIVAPLVLAIM